MDIQLKKGLLDICVLKCLATENSYGYKILSDMSKYMEISESTLYPILKRLEENKCLDIYEEEHNGRKRKYYRLTEKGKTKLAEFKVEYKKLQKIIKFILGGS